VTPDSPLAIPGPKTVAGWWSRFAPLQPTAILAGWFEIARIEVLVETESRRPLAPLTRTGLRAVEVCNAPTLAGIAKLTHLGEPRTASILQTLADDGALELHESGPARVALTELGRQALRTGEVPTAVRSRRVVVLRNGEPIPVPESWGLKPVGQLADLATSSGISEAAIRRAVAHDSTMQLCEQLPAEHRWRTVRIERTEWWPLVVVAMSDRVDVYLGDIADWSLPNERAFTIPSELAPSPFPELIARPTEPDLQAAWIHWAKSRAVAHEELSMCHCRDAGRFFDVGTPPALYDWLQANRADLFSGETVVLIGEGSVKRLGILRVERAD